LSTGLSLLEGQPFGQSIQTGITNFAALDKLDEDQKRRALLAQLIGGGVNQSTMTPANTTITPTTSQPMSLLENLTPQERQIAAALPVDQALNFIGRQISKDSSPPGVKEYRFAQTQGYTGSYLDFVKDKKTPPIADFTLTKPDSNEVVDISIPKAAQGDIPGAASNTANYIAGLFGGVVDEDALQAATDLRAVNLGATVPLTKALSDKGSVYTQERVREILPQPGDNDAQMASKMRSIIPQLERQINEASKIASDPNAQQSYRTNALEMLSSGPAALAAYKNAVENYDRREGRRGSASRKTRRRVVRDPNNPNKFIFAD
jgi:hypothetical protein